MSFNLSMIGWKRIYYGELWGIVYEIVAMCVMQGWKLQAQKNDAQKVYLRLTFK